MSKFLDRERLAKRQAAADLQAEADAAQERARKLSEARSDVEAKYEAVVTVTASVEWGVPAVVSFPPAPRCAACGGEAAIFLVDVAVTWRDEGSGEIRRVLASFCCRECWKGWRPG